MMHVHSYSAHLFHRDSSNTWLQERQTSVLVTFLTKVVFRVSDIIVLLQVVLLDLFSISNLFYQ